LRVGGEETRQGTGNHILKSERTTQSNKPARLGLHPKRGLLGSFSLDDRCPRMLEDLLSDLGQAESPRGSIEQPHSEPILKQSDATTDARFWYAKHASGRREAAIEDDGRKELEIVKIAHHLPLLLFRPCDFSMPQKSCATCPGGPAFPRG
jgi:hypothetical protein